MLVDTDVLIWVLRGNHRAGAAVDQCPSRAISIVTYMELIQGARDKGELKAIKRFLTDLGFRTLPLTENIGHRASIYMEEYVLSDGLSMADALVAATAIEGGEPLLSGNTKHYRVLSELELHSFRP